MDTNPVQQLLEPTVPPRPTEQREIIMNLEKEPEADHAYFVSPTVQELESFVG